MATGAPLGTVTGQRKTSGIHTITAMITPMITGIPMMAEVPKLHAADPPEPEPGAAAAQMLTLARWFSPAFPLGSFAYSQGLETEISNGTVRTGADVHAWLEQILAHGSLRNDAMVLVAARRSTPGIDDFARALAPTSERWEESLNQGTAFAETVTALGGEPVAPAAFPVAVGWASQRLDALEDVTIAAHYLQSVLSGLVSAAVRFVPLGQTEGQRILADLAAPALACAQDASTAPLSDIGSAGFGADLAAAEHETLDVRIFRS